MCSIYLNKIVVIIWICMFISERCGIFTTYNPILFSSPPLHFRCTGRIYWQPALDASSSMTEAEVHLNQTDRDRFYQLMCRNKSVSHMKGRISMVSPRSWASLPWEWKALLEEEKHRKTDRKTVSSFGVRYLIIQSSFCLGLKYAHHSAVITTLK